MALPFGENFQSVEQFPILIAIDLAFCMILYFLWEAIMAIGRKRTVVPVGLAIALSG